MATPIYLKSGLEPKKTRQTMKTYAGVVDSSIVWWFSTMTGRGSTGVLDVMRIESKG
jgi:hypothetical protein